MLKKVATSQIRTGMYIHSVEGSWLKHSLWKTRFVIEDDETLQRVRSCGAAELWIDIELGADVESPPQPVAVTPAAESSPPILPPESRSKARPKATSMTDELHTAAILLNRSKETVTSLFTEARMGNAVDTRECGALVDEVVASVGRHAVGDVFTPLGSQGEWFTSIVCS